MILKKAITGFALTMLLCTTAYAYDTRLLSEIPLKGKASAIAVNTATDTAAIISEAGKSLSLINTASSAVAHEVALPEVPSGVAVHKGSNRAVVSTLDGSLLLYDLKSGGLTDTITIGGAVYSLAVDEVNSRALLGVDGGIAIVDLPSGKVLSKLSFPGKCVQLSLGKSLAAVVSRDGNGSQLRLVNLATDAAIAVASLPGEVMSIGLDESLGSILVTLAEMPGVFLYDASTLKLLDEIQTGKQVEIVSVNPSTHTAVLADTADGSLSIVDLQRRTVVESIPLFGQMGPVCVDTARNRVLAAHNEGVAIVQLENPVPRISGLIPQEKGAGEEGFPLTITGERFIKDSRTRFAGTLFDSLFESNELIKAIIPAEKLLTPGDVPVSVTNPPPGGGVSNELTFKVLTPAPQLASLTPATAVAGSPFTLRVEGKNFLPTAVINFNGKKIEGGFVSSTRLEVPLEASAIAVKGTYPVTVTNKGATGFTSAPLYLDIVTEEEAAALGTGGGVAILGTGSLGGRILNTEMQAIKGVTISYKNVSARTNEFGDFTLENLPAGKRTILINGSTAEDADGHYPVIPISVEIEAGKDNMIPFIPYLHRQKNYNFVNIAQGKDTILTDPEVPGFEMRIPAGVNIIGWDGKRNLRVSVRMVPINRLPVKPVPTNANIRTVYMFYFDKVGGGKPDRPIPIKSPNDLGLLPGEKAVLWYYDESPNEGEAPNDWAIAGTGTVSADGRFIETDSGVGIPKFCCGATAWGGTSASLPTSGKGTCSLAADPVDVTTGYFMHEQVDMVIPGIIPVEIKRIYRSRDSGSAVSGSTGLGAFGKGFYFEYDWWLGSYNSMLRLTKPGTYQYDFALQGDGSYRNTADPDFRGAKVTINADSTKTLRMRDGRTYKFASGGGLIEIADRNGNRVTIQRRSDYEGGYIQSVTTAEGRVVTFSQTSTGGYFRTDSITGPDGRTVRYTYETDPYSPYTRLKTVDYPDGSTLSYGYDSQGRMNSITNRRGSVEVTNVYDTSHRVTSQTHSDGGVYGFDYSVAGQTTMTAPNGAHTTWSYNGYGYITQKITPDGATTYNKAAGTNELLSVTDPLNRTTTYTYFATADARNGLVQSITDPLNNVTSFDYETNYGLPTQITDALGKVTTITYTPSPTTTPPTKAEIRDPLLHLTTVNYNAYGMPTSIIDPNNNTTTLTYDPNNHGQLTSVADPLGNSVSYAYDAIGRLAGMSDAKGASSKYAYDQMDRVNAVTDPLGKVTRYLYDPNGNLVAVYDAKNNRIRYEYDDRDRITKMTDQLDRYETYAYYRNAEITATTGDNMKSFTDRKGQTTTFNEYDPQNRLKKVTFGDASYIQYTYDAAGRATNIYDSLTGSIAWVYNDYGCSSCTGRGLDLISQETTSLSTVNYTYDADGRRASMTVSGEPVVNYTWDDAGRMTKLSRSINGTAKDFNFTYDNGGRRTTYQVPLYMSEGNWNYLTSTYGYDIASHLTSLLHQGPTTTVESLNYAYDPNGNRKNLTRTAGQTLTPVVSTTSHNAANEMLALSTKSFTYDFNGNLATRTDVCGTTTYTWDARNRLTGINGYKPDCSTLSASFSYDAMNRRISKTINGTTTQFVYDGWDVMQEIKSGVTTNYVRTLNIDEPLAKTNSTTTRYYLLDALGSVIGLTDENGVSKTTYVYDAFGNVTTSGETSDNPFQFTGRENDGTGLYYYRARYFSPEMQRFITEDPIRLRGGINFYAMTRNNPVNLIDPLGYFGWPGAIGGGIGGAIGGGVAGYIGSGGDTGAAISGAIGGGIAGFVGGGLGTVSGAIAGAIGGAASAAYTGSGTAAIIGAAIGGGLGGAFGGAVSNAAGVGALGQALGGAEGAWAGSMWGTAFGMLGDGLFGKRPCK